MKPRVLVREEIADAGVRFLRERFDVDVDSDSELAEKIADYDAIIVRSATKLTSDLIERAQRLKVIGRAGVGVDNVDVEAATISAPSTPSGARIAVTTAERSSSGEKSSSPMAFAPSRQARPRRA